MAVGVVVAGGTEAEHDISTVAAVEERGEGQGVWSTQCGLYIHSQGWCWSIFAFLMSTVS